MSFAVTGCYKSCATGDPLGLLTYCDKASYEKLVNPQPYSTHWVKNEITDIQRREDSWACGAANTTLAADHVIFSKEQLKQEKKPSEIDDFSARTRLTKIWIACMKTKGYEYQP